MFWHFGKWASKISFTLTRGARMSGEHNEFIYLWLYNNYTNNSSNNNCNKYNTSNIKNNKRA